MIRHGDVMLRPVEAPYRMTLGSAGEKLVLAEGEATGHAHVLTGAVVPATAGHRAYVQVLEPSLLTHEEHKEARVPPGWYEVVRQRVYTPSAPVYVAD